MKGRAERKQNKMETKTQQIRKPDLPGKVNSNDYPLSSKKRKQNSKTIDKKFEALITP